MIRKFFYLSVFVMLYLPLYGDEGMWLPHLLKQMNEADMKERGLKLSADDIYSINNTSLKDGVLLFGGGCTGEVISGDGLLLTNHHCGYSSIQSHSSVQNDYLTTGYWAKNKSEELSCPNLTAMFIIRIEDVTQQVVSHLEAGMSESDREAKIKSITSVLEKKAIEGTHYGAMTRSFFYGNVFYMFVTETFLDVRLVGAPPSSIGKFGDETDNWVWPRQTGDFSLFRIYAGPDNKPAVFSKDNKPFKPRFHFKISLAGVQEGDFTMVFGFPGRTNEYLTSYGVALTYEQSNPARIKIRKTRLAIMDEGMHLSDSIRIAYTAKYATISNYYKKWQGEQLGLKKNNAVGKKSEQEKLFSEWVMKDAERKNKYGTLLPQFEMAYASLKPYIKTSDYIAETLFGIELVTFVSNYKAVVAHSTADSIDHQALKKATDRIAGSHLFFRNYHQPTDKKLCKAMLKIYFEDMDTAMYPAVHRTITKKYKGSVDAYVDDLYKKSWLLKQEKVKAFFAEYKPSDVKKITSDPAYVLYSSIADLQARIAGPLAVHNEEVLRLQRIYMMALQEMHIDRKFYPDANLTLRVAYGNVKGFAPRDGLVYKHYTTLDGVMEKADPLDEEFIVPEKLTELFNKKDYGRYGVNGVMPVAFIATNHTTGGNSGSPVINSRGELIGTNFDRVWEGTMSDIMYDPEICRNITLDIRYTLFIIDKFAGAGYLVDEMTLVQ